MPRFEILIPKSAGAPADLRLRLESDSWLDALRGGMDRIGLGGTEIEGLLVDIRDDGCIHVTHSATGAAFRIQELGPEPDAAPTAEDGAPTAPEMPAAAAPEDTTPTAPSLPAVTTPMAAAPVPARATPAKGPRRRSRERMPAVQSQSPPARMPDIGRALAQSTDSAADLLEEIFDSTQQVHEQPGRHEALYFMLDLAMKKVNTESGSVLLADINTDELVFGAARGPKAEEVMRFRIKMGQGLVGFCAEEGCGLAVSDANRDPRFYREVSERIGYPTRSILCVPLVTNGQVFGALELINHLAGDSFNERDLNVAGFIAGQLAQYLARGSA